MCRADTWLHGYLKLQMLRWFMGSMCSIQMSLRVQRVCEKTWLWYTMMCESGHWEVHRHILNQQRKGQTQHVHLNLLQKSTRTLKRICIYYLHMRVVQTFTYMQYICCWVKRLIQITFCLLSPSLTWVASIMKAVVWLYDGLQAASGYQVNTASVYMLFCIVCWPAVCSFSTAQQWDACAAWSLSEWCLNFREHVQPLRYERKESIEGVPSDLSFPN